MRPSWDEYFMALAKIISTRSTCASRPTGAVLVRDNHILSTGYNGSMPGAPHCLGTKASDGTPFCFRRSMNLPESDKYNFCRASHAEANAIAQSARKGISIEGSTLYVTLAPCYVCLKLLATAGVKHIFFEYTYESTNKDRDLFWKEQVRSSKIETYKEIKISDNTREKILEALYYPTSMRRLGENKAGLMMSRDEKNTLLRKTETIDGYATRKFLLDSISGKREEDGNIYGREIFINVNIRASPENIANPVQQHNPLLNMAGIDYSLHAIDDLIDAMAGNIDNTHETIFSNSSLTVDLSRSGNENKIIYHIDSLDIFQDLSLLSDTAILVTQKLALTIMDKIDIGMDIDMITIHINKPYVRSNDSEMIKKIILGENSSC